MRLICTNAMTYNNSKTYYYKEAKKILSFSKKLERAEMLKKSATHMALKGIMILLFPPCYVILTLFCRLYQELQQEKGRGE